VEAIVERPAALDVHKARVTGCVRVPGERGGRGRHVAGFATTVRGLLALRDWLAGHGVQRVVMEASGVDWKAPWAVLEVEFGCMLVTPGTSSRSRAARPTCPTRRGCVSSRRRAC
jgi:transposase